MRRRKRKTAWAYLVGKKLVDVVQAVPDLLFAPLRGLIFTLIFTL